MDIDKIFQSGVDIEPYLEELEMKILENEEYYLLDILPKTVPATSANTIYEAPDKYFDQFELVWGRILDNNDSLKQKAFLKEEEKFVSFFKKLWLYNNTKASISENFIINKKSFIHHVRDLGSDLKESEEIYDWAKKNADKTMYVNDIKTLELLIRLGVRDTLSNIIIFEDMQIISWSTGSLSRVIYFNEPDEIALVKEMANVEGLYLYRKKK